MTIATWQAAASLLMLLGAAVPVGATDRGHPPLPPAALTVGDRDTPLGVEGTPLFGWQPRDRDPGERQSAYQIRVFGPAGKTPLWDSGKRPSPQTAFVPYAGEELTGGATYRWTVRTWDRTGVASPWAARATFGTTAPCAR